MIEDQVLDIMRKNMIVCLLVGLLGISGCSTVQVSQDYRPGMDFSGLRSYSWLPREQESGDPRVTNPLLHERFREAIDGSLRLRGMAFAQPGDFQVSYTYSIATKIESDPVDTHVGFGVGRYSRYGGVGFGSGTSVRQYDVGTLVIDFVEPGSGRLLWRGTGSERLVSNPTPEKNIEFANRLVTAIIDQFPAGIR